MYADRSSARFVYALSGGVDVGRGFLRRRCDEGTRLLPRVSGLKDDGKIDGTFRGEKRKIGGRCVIRVAVARWWAADLRGYSGGRLLLGLF